MTRLVFGLLLCVLPHSTLAQLPPPGPGDLWISFDEIGNKLCTVTPPFVTTNQFYVLATDLAGDIAGYEFSLSIDPSTVVFAANDLTNPGSINVGTPPQEWIVGIGNCVAGVGIVPLVQFTYGLFVQDSLEHLVCQQPSDPSSFVPATPGYLDCSGGLLPFTPHPDGSFNGPAGCGFFYIAGGEPPNFDVGTCSLEGLPADADSWGSIKSRFR